MLVGGPYGRNRSVITGDGSHAHVEAPLTLGLFSPAPWFTARSHRNPIFQFSSLGGRFVLLVVLPLEPAARDEAIARILEAAPRFHDDHVACFGVIRDEDRFNSLAERRGLRWFHDPDGAIATLFGAKPEASDNPVGWVLIDPALRVLAIDPIARGQEALARLSLLPAVDDHAKAPLHAPVLLIPRIFEPELCRELIALYDRQGGVPTGVMREVDGRTVGVLSDFKKRSDVYIEDDELKRALRARISSRLLPEITRAFQFSATRIERYLVACYDAETGGYFRPHRDNTTSGTVHRRFAVSINLNAEAFDGGDLRFPEYGARTYRPPTGGAVVFSCSLLHEATPVTEGRRYAFLPFLFDEAGEKVRQANLHLLDKGPTRDIRGNRSN